MNKLRLLSRILGCVHNSAYIMTKLGLTVFSRGIHSHVWLLVVNSLTYFGRGI